MTKTSAALRESIRQGLIGAHVDRAEFEWAVAEVYRLEHEEEAEMIRLRENSRPADGADDSSPRAVATGAD
jgi:hypothetical protein